MVYAGPQSPKGRWIEYVEGDAGSIVERGERIEQLGQSMIASADTLEQVKDGADGQRGLAVEKLREVVGEPPFIVRRGARRREAPAYDSLRAAIMDLAREGISLSRFKGLGEMMASQLKETTMDPKKRTLARITVPDAETSVEDLVERLMGKRADARFQFIQENAQFVKEDLDV